MELDDDKLKARSEAEEILRKNFSDLADLMIEDGEKWDHIAAALSDVLVPFLWRHSPPEVFARVARLLIATQRLHVRNYLTKDAGHAFADIEAKGTQFGTA